MSKGPKGASKDIIKNVSGFVQKMNAHYKKLQKEKNKGKDPKKKAELFPLLTFQIGQDAKAKFRTPKEQAVLLARKNKPGKTTSARSAHMTDRARHVPVRVNGVVKGSSYIITALGDEGANFKSTWVKQMKDHDLYSGSNQKQIFWDKDWGHLELKDRELPKTSELVVECLEWYVKLVDNDFARLNNGKDGKGGLEKHEGDRLKKIRGRLNIEKPEKKEKKAADKK